MSLEASQTGKLWANVTIEPTIPARAYDPMIFGGFLEYFGRQIYGGVFARSLFTPRG